MYGQFIPVGLYRYFLSPKEHLFQSSTSSGICFSPSLLRTFLLRGCPPSYFYVDSCSRPALGVVASFLRVCQKVNWLHLIFFVWDNLSLLLTWQVSAAALMGPHVDLHRFYFEPISFSKQVSPWRVQLHVRVLFHHRVLVATCFASGPQKAGCRVSCN